MGISTFFIRLFEDLPAAAGPDILWGKTALFLRGIDAGPHTLTLSPSGFSL
jgi:hypothetical protein